MAIKIIRAQVTSRVVRPGDPLAFGAKGTPTPPPPPGFSLYNFVRQTLPNPPPGEAWSGPSAVILTINQVDFDGRDVGAIIAALAAGDLLVVQGVSYSIGGTPTISLPGTYQIPLAAPVTFPQGLFEVYVVKGAP